MRCLTILLLLILPAVPGCSNGPNSPDDPDARAHADALTAFDRIPEPIPAAGVPGPIEQLMIDLRGATRIEVRAPETRRGRSTPVGVEREPSAVADLIGNLQFIESPDGTWCGCAGHAELDFYRGDKFLLTLVVYHGDGIVRNGWDGLGFLAEPAKAWLVDWLACHGAPWSKQEHEAELQGVIANARLLDHYRKLLGDEVVAAITSAKSEEQARAALARAVPDPVQRRLFYFRMMGGDRASWGQTKPLDISESGLFREEIDPWDLAAAARLAIDDSQGREGLARYVFMEGGYQQLSDEALADLLESLARHALGHPRADNRHKAVLALGRIAANSLNVKPAAKARLALRDCLAGRIIVRDLPPDERYDTRGGWWANKPIALLFDDFTALPPETSTRAHAAWELAELGDTESLPLVRELLKTAQGTDREVLTRTAKHLERSTVPDRGD